MSRIDYDDAYANAEYIPNADDFITRWHSDASAFRSDMLEQHMMSFILRVRQRAL